jgi:hypothetical protein
VSLILDALNRSRQDSDPVPGLATEHFGESPQQGWRQYLPWSALLVALLIIGALLLERGDPAPVAVMGWSLNPKSLRSRLLRRSLSRNPRR